MPATPELVATFLTELADQGLSVATLRLQKAALGRAHRSIYTPDPTATQGVRRVMAGIAREHGRPQRQANPLTEAALAAVRVTAAIPKLKPRWDVHFQVLGIGPEVSREPPGP